MIFTYFLKVWPWLLKTFGQGHPHLGHQVKEIEMHVFAKTIDFSNNWWLLNFQCLVNNRKYIKQEAFRERRHLHVCDLGPCGLVWPWPFVKVKKDYVIRCRLLFCTVVLGMMSMGLILYEILQFVYLMWHLTITCDLQPLSRTLDLLSLDVHYIVECLYQNWSL